MGSLNWSTSSKANSECGVHLGLASTPTAPLAADFMREFQRVFDAAERLQDAKPPGAISRRLCPAAPARHVLHRRVQRYVTCLRQDSAQHRSQILRAFIAAASFKPGCFYQEPEPRPADASGRTPARLAQ